MLCVYLGVLNNNNNNKGRFLRAYLVKKMCARTERSEKVQMIRKYLEQSRK